MPWLVLVLAARHRAGDRRRAVPVTLVAGATISLMAAAFVAWRFRLAGAAGMLGQTSLTTVDA